VEEEEGRRRRRRRNRKRTRRRRRTTTTMTVLFQKIGPIVGVHLILYTGRYGTYKLEGR
jgi:hypothetical protein